MIEYLLASPLLFLVDDAHRYNWTGNGAGLTSKFLPLLVRNGCVAASTSAVDLPIEEPVFQELFRKATSVNIADLTWRSTAAVAEGSVTNLGLDRYLADIGRPLKYMLKNPFIAARIPQILAREEPERHWSLFGALEAIVAEQVGESDNEVIAHLLDAVLPELAFDRKLKSGTSLTDAEARLGRRLNLLEQRDVLTFKDKLIEEYFLAIAVRRRLTEENSDVILSALFSAARSNISKPLRDRIRMLCGCLDDSGLSNLIGYLMKRGDNGLAHTGLFELEPMRYHDNPKCREIANRLVKSIESGGEAAALAATALSYYDPRLPSFPEGLVTLSERSFPSERSVPSESITETERSTLSAGRYPVTNLEFSRFVQADGYSRDEFWTAAGTRWKKDSRISFPAFWTYPEYSLPNSPVVGISFHEAMAYCRWLTSLSENSGQVARLPRASEWDRAADIVPPLIVTANAELDFSLNGHAMLDSVLKALQPSEKQRRSPGPRPVGMYPANQRGLSDVFGNVWEWCDELAGQDGPIVHSLAEGFPANNLTGLVKGGPCIDTNRDIEAVIGGSLDLRSRVHIVGFRVFSQARLVGSK